MSTSREQEQTVQASKCQGNLLPGTCWLERSDLVITIGPEKEAIFQLCQAFIATTVKGVAVETALPQDVHRRGADETFLDH
jgi:hypothetical protein